MHLMQSLHVCRTVRELQNLIMRSPHSHIRGTNTYLYQSDTSSVFVESRHSDLSADSASLEHGDDETAFRATR